MLWWGLFDNELYVEHSERRRFGLAPSAARSSAPVPRLQESAKLSNAPSVSKHSPGSWHLPRTALEGHPHARAFEQATDAASHPVRGPDPLSGVHLSQRADGQTRHCGLLELPLAKLSPEQRAQIDAILATTLKKKDVIAQVRALYPSGDGRRDAMLSSDGHYRLLRDSQGSRRFSGTDHRGTCSGNSSSRSNSASWWSCPGSGVRQDNHAAAGPGVDRAGEGDSGLEALSVEKSQIHLGGLIVALFADLAERGQNPRPNPNGGNVPSAIW